MSKFFIERPILANVIAIVTILLGAVCLLFWMHMKSFVWMETGDWLR